MRLDDYITNALYHSKQIDKDAHAALGIRVGQISIH